MTAIMPSDSVSSVASHSVDWTRNAGQIPHTERTRVSRAAGMIIPVSGTAIRFVSRKYCGKVPKYAYAIGPVVSWQDIDMAAEFQTHLIAGNL